uniref:Uncharacterized protein n=1 Tax=Trichuris muris TaxID=70415 RepID=A0A5S6QIS1_TRIMR
MGEPVNLCVLYFSAPSRASLSRKRRTSTKLNCVLSSFSAVTICLCNFFASFHKVCVHIGQNLFCIILI